jgi:hypothetical protein
MSAIAQRKAVHRAVVFVSASENLCVSAYRQTQRPQKIDLEALDTPSAHGCFLRIAVKIDGDVSADGGLTNWNKT